MGNKFFSVFGKIVLVLIVLGAVGYGAYYIGKMSSVKDNAAQTQLEVEKSTTTSAPAESPTPSADETSVIIKAIKDGLIAEHGQNAASLNVTVSKIQGEYASGGASEQGGGGMWFAVRENGIWKLVWDGNGQIQCSNLSPYPNYPISMIPECWDDSTQNVVKR